MNHNVSLSGVILPPPWLEFWGKTASILQKPGGAFCWKSTSYEFNTDNDENKEDPKMVKGMRFEGTCTYNKKPCLLGEYVFVSQQAIGAFLFFFLLDNNYFLFIADNAGGMSSFRRWIWEHQAWVDVKVQEHDYRKLIDAESIMVFNRDNLDSS